jgi:hypothetical protein
LYYGTRLFDVSGLKFEVLVTSNLEHQTSNYLILQM